MTASSLSPALAKVDRARERRALWLFLSVSFGLSWILDVLPWALSSTTESLRRVLFPIAMWGPGLGAILAIRSVLKVPVVPFLRLRFLRLRGKFGAAFVVAFLAPPVLALLAIGLAWALGIGDWRPPAGRPAPGKLAVIVGAATVIGPFLNLPFALGEELGWRGFLEPQLTRKWGRWGLFATGIIWGIWHAPVVLQGHNYPGHPWIGLPMMVVVTSLLNVVLVWCRRRSGSVWAPALAHGGINALAGLAGLLFARVDSRIGPPVGLVAWIPSALLAWWLSRCLPPGDEPEASQPDGPGGVCPEAPSADSGTVDAHGSSAPRHTEPTFHLVLYDGVCALCDGFTSFVLARDRLDQFRFAPLQGALARERLLRHGREASQLETIYVIRAYGGRNEQLLSRGAAMVFILGSLGGAWSYVRLLDLFPARLLDVAYEQAARRRYRWFGRYQSCVVPTGRHRAKFIGV